MNDDTTTRRKVQCDICGKTISMAATDRIPVHVGRFGSQWVHPEHVFWGFPLAFWGESVVALAEQRRNRTLWQQFIEWLSQ